MISVPAISYIAIWMCPLPSKCLQLSTLFLLLLNYGTCLQERNGVFRSLFASGHMRSRWDMIKARLILMVVTPRLGFIRSLVILLRYLILDLDPYIRLRLKNHLVRLVTEA